MSKIISFPKTKKDTQEQKILYLQSCLQQNVIKLAELRAKFERLETSVKKNSKIRLVYDNERNAKD